MPSVIARDSVASDHLVYAWPFPIGPDEYEVSCGEDELVVMCPSWTVGDRLGPGRHRWRTPDPMRPVSAFFVLTAPVEVSFDMTTSFMIPIHARPVRLRATGSLQVRCADPALLVAQFVGLPFDSVNDGIIRSVSRSVERMLARLLTRRVVMGATPMAVTDPGAMPSILEELVAYNPAAGAVFGIELMRMGHLSIYADDGSKPLPELSNQTNGSVTERAAPPPAVMFGEIPLKETVRVKAVAPPPEPPAVAAQGTPPPASLTPTTPNPIVQPSVVVAPDVPSKQGNPVTSASGEIVSREPRSLKETVKGPAIPPLKATPTTMPPIPPAVKATTIPPPIPAKAVQTTPPPANKKRTPPSVEVQAPDEATQPGVDIVRTPLPGSIRLPTPSPAPVDGKESRGAIIGIGTGVIGETSSGGVAASGEIGPKVKPGARVLVPGPGGLMQSATVRQLLQGYYELEVGSSGETIWVPVNGVVPE